MAENFSTMRKKVKSLVRTKFRKKWQWKVSFEGQPSEFDLFVKDITYGPTEVTTDAVKVGAMVLTYVESLTPVTISMTMRDHEDSRIAKWFDAWAAKAVHADGTVGLPYGSDGYVKKMTLYFVNDEGEASEDDSWDVLPGKRGDVTLSYDESGGHTEFAITFTQFCSTGANLTSKATV